MRRGTTPDIVVRVRGADLTGCTVWLTLKGDSEVTFTDADGRLAIETEPQADGSVDTLITFRLTQEETLAMNTRKQALIQARWIDAQGVADASAIGSLSFGDILKDGVIAYAG